ncbi:glycosyltransferase [Urechidicola croceus]|uniref:Glycosyl transferase family 1 domain-containing protein n=1 Tax=Urechidicola croceus TaxID=1850246 RepID=A0A1D8P6B2_9FLAO|nr:glycosyltransferase [Urechidicola croceus]AOW20104.1 hypothetical protein LPB138_05150 [Urechidicola croceus]
MKRIIHIVGSMNRAGAETMVMNLYRQLDRENYQFDFIYFTNNDCDYDDEIKELRGKIYRIPSKNVFSRYLKYFSLLRKLDKNTSIHSHMNINNSMYLGIAYLAGIKTRVSHCHGTEGKYHQSFLRRIYKKFSFSLIDRFATKYIACGEAAGKYLYPKVKSSEITLLPNAIDVRKFSESRVVNRNYLRNLLNLEKDVIILTQIGRLIKVKNHTFSIQFLKHLKSKGIKFHFVIIGDGELNDSLKELVNKEDLEDNVTFLGVRSDVPELLSGSDCMLMPSLHEGFPVVLVESQAIGLPSLISDTISPEVDLGLKLVVFSGLNDDFSIWEEKLLNILLQEDIKAGKISEVLTDRGFNIVESVKKLERIYG